MSDTFCKLSILLSLTVLAGCARHAGPGGASSAEKHFSRGMWDLSVSGTTSFHRADSEFIDKATTFEFSPQYGYFVTDRLEVLGAVGVGYEDAKYKRRNQPLELGRAKYQNYSMAVGLQYNWDDGSKVIPFARGFVGLIKSRRELVQRNVPLVGTAEDRDETTAPYLGVRVGVRYFMARNLSTDVGFGWKRVFYGDDFGNDTDDFSVVIGCSLLF